MKVLFLGPNFAAGGAERVSATLAVGLHERGHDVRSLGLDSGGPVCQLLESGSVPFEVLGMRSRVDIPRLCFSNLLRRFGPDVIISRGTSGICVGQALAEIRRSAHVFSDHLQPGLPVPARQKLLTGGAALRLNRVILVSESQRVNWSGLPLKPRKLTVIPNGVDEPALASRRAVRQSLGIPDEAVVFVLAARLRPEKNITLFLESVLRANAINPAVLGLVVGDGAQKPLLDSYAAQHGCVRAVGHQDVVGPFLRASDAFVLSSDYEAQPISMLEAFACGLPAVGTDVGEVRQMVTPDRGYVVAPRDVGAMAAALLALARDESLRHRMGTATRAAWQDRWTLTGMIDTYESVLKAEVSA